AEAAFRGAQERNSGRSDQIPRIAAARRAAARTSSPEGKVPALMGGLFLSSRFQTLSQPAGKVLHELPGDAAGAAAARRRPFQCLGTRDFAIRTQPEMADIALDHLEIFVLRPSVEAEPQAETVGQRNLLLDRLGWVDRRRALILDHVARQEVPAVGGCIKDH